VKFFIDTEFHEDGTTIDLISIGIVGEDGREFYAISRDCDYDRIWTLDSCDWLRKNVMNYLPPPTEIRAAGLPRTEIRDAILAFVAPPPGVTLNDDKPEFWGYYADYDWVAFCQLFGRMIDLPKHFPKYCRDLKQVADVMKIRLPPPREDEHHALADARWIRDSYLFCVHQAKERG
jgi:hypothetical protein